MKKKKILCFFGTRPEAIKMAPVVKAVQESPFLQSLVVLSAQHRDMLDQVLSLFKIKPQADLNLMKPGQSLTDITAGVLTSLEPLLEKYKPDMMLVHGDTTTSLAGTLAAFYKNIPVGHVEAGLRTHDLSRPFPEEMNRQVTDVLAALYFAPTQESKKNLLKEGRQSDRVFVTGNTVIDALLSTAQGKRSFDEAALRSFVPALVHNKNPLILMTAHRRENFGKPFQAVCEAVKSLSIQFPQVHWVYPVHPNPHVLKPAHAILGRQKNIHLLSPLGYGDLVGLMKLSTLVVTDSGGLQEEAPSLGKPVLVLRDVTERPEAVTSGTVQLVGTHPQKIKMAVTRLLKDVVFYNRMATAVNPYGDGLASKRITHAMEWYFKLRRNKPASFEPS